MCVCVCVCVCVNKRRQPGEEKLNVYVVLCKKRSENFFLSPILPRLLLLLLLSRFSRVRLCATPQTAAHQALPSRGFSRQEHWSGLPFPSPMHESESEVAQSCPALRDLMDCSLPGSSTHGIFQARVLEWVAIAFSTAETSTSQITFVCWRIHFYSLVFAFSFPVIDQYHTSYKMKYFNNSI